MSSSGTVGEPAGFPHTAAQGSGQITLGLLAAPELPARLATRLAVELPELLSQRVDDRVLWRVPVIYDPLTGSKPDSPGILDVGRVWLEQEGLDLAICLTDLPLRRRGQLVVADVSVARKVAALSVPALGVTGLHRRTCEAVIQLAYELHMGLAVRRSNDEQADGRTVHYPDQKPRQLIGGRLNRLAFPIWQIVPDDDMSDLDVDVRFIAPLVRGHPQLLAGMVLANRPWTLFSSLKSTIAAGLATGAYALLESDVWQLSDRLSPWHLMTLMVLSISAIIVWIIIVHDLWERPSEPEPPGLTALYNTATALTLTVAVLISYAGLFALIFVPALFFIPGGLLHETLGHPVTFWDYVTLTWIATSLATMASALGSGLEDEETVREATYGYRQRRRGEEQNT